MFWVASALSGPRRFSFTNEVWHAVQRSEQAGMCGRARSMKTPVEQALNEHVLVNNENLNGHVVLTPNLES